MDYSDKSVLYCRGCLEEVKPKDLYSFLWPDIRDLYVKCTGLLIPPDDDLPQQICPTCFSQCEQWHYFRSKCHDANQRLLEDRPSAEEEFFFSGFKVKEEIPEQPHHNDDSLQSYHFGELVEDPQPVVLIERLRLEDIPQLIANAKRAAAKNFAKKPALKEICPLCKNNYGPSFWKHIKLCHLEKGSNTCPICHKDFNYLNSHVLTHVVLRPFVCPFCNHRFQEESYLRNHLRLFHNSNRPNNSTSSSSPRKKIKNYFCPACSSSFKSVGCLQDHFVASHTDERPFECPHCSADFAYRSSVYRHMQKVHKDFTVGQIRAKPGSIYHNPRPWELLGYQLGSEGQQQVQKKSTSHSKKTLPNGKPLKCRYCGRKFGTKHQITIHLRQVHPGRSRMMGILKVGAEPPPPKKKEVAKPLNKDVAVTGGLQCKICRKTFVKLNALKAHSVVHMKVRPFGCKLCKKSFPYQAMAVNHLQKMHGCSPDHGLVVRKRRDETPPKETTQNVHHPRRISLPKCWQCFEKFPTNADLMEHMRTHPPRQSHPYECDVCGNSFNNSFSLRQHKLHHETPQQRISCPLCPVTFKHRKYFGRHMQHVHSKGQQLTIKPEPDIVAKSGWELLACSQCGKRFHTATALRGHLANHDPSDSVSTDSGVRED